MTVKYRYMYSIPWRIQTLRRGGGGFFCLPWRFFCLLRFFVFLFLTQTKTEGRYHRGPSLVPPLLFTILVKTDKRYIALYILRTVSYIFPLPLQRPHCLLQAPPLSAHGIPVEYRSQLLVDMLSIRISSLSPVMFHSLACEPPWTAVPPLKS